MTSPFNQNIPLIYLGKTPDGQYLKMQGNGYNLFVGRTRSEILIEKDDVVFSTNEDSELLKQIQHRSCIVEPAVFSALLKKLGARRAAMVEMAYDCNLRCIHCYVSNRTDNENKQKKIITSNIKQLINSLMKLNILEVTITGGEIFLIKDITNVIRDISEHFAVTVLTNATLMKSDHVSSLAELPIRHLQTTVFSFDEAIHDSITGVKGSHSKTMQVIEQIRNHRMRFIASIPVLEKNIDTLEKTKKWLEQQEVPYSINYIIFPSTESAKNCLPKPERLGNDTKTGIIPQLEPVLCTAFYSKIRIDPYGNIYPCEFSNDSIGNIFSTDFNEESIRGSFTHLQSHGFSQNKELNNRQTDKKFYDCPARNKLDSGHYSNPSKYINELNLAMGLHSLHEFADWH